MKLDTILREKMLIFRGLALLCVVVLSTACISREVLNQGKAYATENLEIAKQVIADKDKQKCATDFRQTDRLRNKDSWVFRGAFRPSAYLTKTVARQHLNRGETEFASKVVVFYTTAHGEVWARLPASIWLVCYYKVENNRLVFLKSCFNSERCPYYFQLPRRAHSPLLSAILSP